MAVNYLIELKNRILLVFGMWLCLIVVSYSNKETLLFIFAKPWLTLSVLENSLYFISTNLTEIFISYVQISYFISNQITFFYVLYHLIVFLIPGLYCKEYKAIIIRFIGFFFLFLIFLIIFNKITFPFVCSFFLTLQKTLNGKIFTLYFEAKMSEYLNFYIILYKLCFIVLGSFVLILTFNEYLMFHNFKLFIKNSRKYYYILFIGISTMISPPEINFQLFISCVLVLLYEILLVVIIFKKTLKF